MFAAFFGGMADKGQWLSRGNGRQPMINKYSRSYCDAGSDDVTVAVDVRRTCREDGHRDSKPLMLQDGGDVPPWYTSAKPEAAALHRLASDSYCYRDAVSVSCVSNARGKREGGIVVV
ncbi:hypothetical protein AC578_2094 [Pseudocercospora eumusae]|uniref:Uncharacterized protein n=1 Tax=Pseudocercospora eumusae TaxID=321146 RepID=A0A139HQ96_9PEZI|nr:hypothetical protein AC578_2094 [Pseudocercospora eumusae]